MLEAWAPPRATSFVLLLRLRLDEAQRRIERDPAAGGDTGRRDSTRADRRQ
jgi:hypothetical protein